MGSANAGTGADAKVSDVRSGLCCDVNRGGNLGQRRNMAAYFGNSDLYCYPMLVRRSSCLRKATIELAKKSSRAGSFDCLQIVAISDDHSGADE